MLDRYFSISTWEIWQLWRFKLTYYYPAPQASDKSIARISRTLLHLRWGQISQWKISCCSRWHVEMVFPTPKAVSTSLLKSALGVHSCSGGCVVQLAKIRVWNYSGGMPDERLVRWLLHCSVSWVPGVTPAQDCGKPRLLLKWLP